MPPANLVQNEPLTLNTRDDSQCLPPTWATLKPTTYKSQVTHIVNRNQPVAVTYNVGITWKTVIPTISVLPNQNEAQLIPIQRSDDA